LAQEQGKEVSDIRIKEVSKEGANYELHEKQILKWMEVYDIVMSDVDEEAIVMVPRARDRDSDCK
jgi:hypothetical protein